MNKSDILIMFIFYELEISLRNEKKIFNLNKIII